MQPEPKLIKNRIDAFLEVLPWFLLVLAFGFIFRIIFLSAPLQSDDTSYFALASDLSADMFKDARQISFRLGLIFPLAILQKLLGYSLAAYYTYSIGSSLLLLAMIFIVSHGVCGLQTAIISGLIFACSYFGLQQSTNVLPDVPNLVFLLACFLAFTYADVTKGGKRILILLLAACLAFYSYLIREPNLIFLLSLPVYELLEKKTVRNTIQFSVFFFILWIGEGLFYKFIADDFLLRMKMIPKGVTLWEINMPQISILNYLFEPLKNLTNSISGIILSSGGMIGALVAVWHKNRRMIALLSGGACIFIAYSYSVSSISPLTRALPLQARYILAFTVVLTIATGYAISNIPHYLKKVFNEKITLGVVTTIVVCILMFQILELPKIITNSVLFKNNSFFIADQFLKSKKVITKLQGQVYAYPFKDFNMYPNFSKLNLKSFLPTETYNSDKYILYSRSFIQRRLHYLSSAKDQASIQKLTLLLLPQNPAWKYIINTDEIVLAQVKNLGSKRTLVIKADEMMSLPWSYPEQIVTTDQLKNGTLFKIAKHKKAFQCYTFRGNSAVSPIESSPIFDKLIPGNIYEFTIRYKLDSSMQSLEFSFSQYSDQERIDTFYSNLPPTKGENEVTLYVATNASYKRFRIFFKMHNQEAQNTLVINNMSFSLISD